MNKQNTFLRLFEDVELKRISSDSILSKDEDTNEVKRENLSNFIFANTNGGTELFTVYTIRKNDSKTDPSKKAGDKMAINGKLKIPEKCIKGTGSHLGTAKDLYSNYKLLRILVSSVDGEPYPPCSIRSFDVSNIFKLVIGRETYNII